MKVLDSASEMNMLQQYITDLWTVNITEETSHFGAVKCCHFLLVLASLSYLIVLASDDIYHVQVDSFAFPIYYVLVVQNADDGRRREVW